jgi:hypothetical protein
MTGTEALGFAAVMAAVALLIAFGVTIDRKLSGANRRAQGSKRHRGRTGPDKTSARPPNPSSIQ